MMWGMTTSVEELTADLALALELASRADVTARAAYSAGVRTRMKPDRTPVTNVDLAVDRVLVENLRTVRPHDAILSEESGLHGDGARGWIIDPIDGTSNLVRGHRHWGTQLALEIDGTIAIGVVTRPMLDARWWAVRGGGAFKSERGGPPERLAVSRRADVASAQIRLWSDDLDDVARVRAATTWTDADMNDILDVAEGRCDAVLCAHGEIWDHAPNQLIVEEAGGRFRDVRGGRRLDGSRAHYTNGVIDEGVDALLA
jgi:histidinol-phosphatase